MSYSPPSTIAIPMVSGYGPWGLVNSATIAAAPASAAWPTANLAVYVPIVVPTPCVIRRVWWVNGATVSESYNVDCGVYADAGYKPGALLVSSGSTAQGTANNVQFADVTDTTLGPGQYWLALAMSSTSATTFRVNPGAAQDASVLFTEASPVPLPASATPAEPSWGSPAYAVFGFATTASP